LPGRTTSAALALAVFLGAAALAPLGETAVGPAGDRGAELPRGGKRIFPRHLVVGFYGAPQSPQLGELGIGSPESAAARLRRQAAPYARIAKRKRLLPAFELIATIALAGPGADGLYRSRQRRGVIKRYLRVARRKRMLLVLDIQPGRSKFIDEVRRLRPFLRRPNVGLALDPEWNMGPGGVPGETIGSVDASMVNKVSRLMAKIARRRGLPQKLLVVHQFTPDMVRGKGRLRTRRRVAMVLNADGFGTPAQKRAKYRQLAPRGDAIHPGFKLFYEEDTNLMSPREVMGLKPRPRFVVYE
jgi:hypothetical protein